jgi:hypothetical protein
LKGKLEKNLTSCSFSREGIDTKLIKNPAFASTILQGKIGYKIKI